MTLSKIKTFANRATEERFRKGEVKRLPVKDGDAYDVEFCDYH